MEHIVTEGDSGELRRAYSISILNDFLESQKRSLERLRDDVKRLEELKSQALVEPAGTLEQVLSEPSQRYLRLSEASHELEVDIPDLDWSLFAQVDDTPDISLPTSSSRAKRIRSDMLKFDESFATLPDLPTNLLDDTESKGKKRKRTESVSRSLKPFSPTYSGGLRLPLATTFHDALVRPSTLTLNQPLIEQHPAQTINPGPNLHQPFISKALPNPSSYFHTDYAHQRRTWASKNPTTPFTAAAPDSHSHPDSPAPEVELSLVDQPNGHASLAVQQTPQSDPPNTEEESLATFKKNWSLEEQHMLEKLLVEIPSTVKFRQVIEASRSYSSRLMGKLFRWVKISEAMGGARTPRQVASRVQKYYEKMKKMGVAIDSTEMGGGGRGGSKATQNLETPIRKPSASRQSTRGLPKTGPQYTKSGRRR